LALLFLVFLLLFLLILFLLVLLVLVLLVLVLLLVGDWRRVLFVVAANIDLQSAAHFVII
jgi:hypothetical protein